MVGKKSEEKLKFSKRGKGMARARNIHLEFEEGMVSDIPVEMTLADLLKGCKVLRDTVGKLQQENALLRKDRLRIEELIWAHNTVAQRLALEENRSAALKKRLQLVAAMHSDLAEVREIKEKAEEDERRLTEAILSMSYR